MDSDNKDPDSLEETNTSVIETDSLESPGSGVAVPAPGQDASKVKGRNFLAVLKTLGRRVNIYMLLFILVLVISAGVLAVTAMSGHTSKDPTIAAQSIPTDTLKQLAKTDATVGDPKQVLNVQSNAVFAGKVLVRDSLDVAGQIHVNGSLSLPGITVTGESSFDQVQVNKTLSIGGDASILGQLNVKKNIAVSGSATFGGPLTAPQLTTSQLQILGDLTLTSHVVAGGVTPGRSGGTALGSGGTASVSGSDTAGSININVGGGAAAGCFLTVSFASRYNSNPHVVIAPTNSAAATVYYYVTHTTSGFSVCTVSAPPAGSYSFDYIVIG